MRLTREGKRFFLATALIAIAAVNTGNNLIYLILSLMLSFTALAYLLLRINLSALLLHISFNGPVFAGEPAAAEVVIRNRKNIPAYSCSIYAADARESIYFGHIPARSSVSGTLRMVFEKRGMYGYRDFSIQSGFPFILFRKSVPVEVAGNVLVYPPIIDVGELAGGLKAQEDKGERAVRSKGDDIYSLREYQYGDDLRDIHWKASARMSGLMVKEYAEYLSMRITLILDNSMPLDEQNFEKAVSVAASLVNHYIGRGCLVRLLSCRKVVPFGSGEGHLYSILDILALLHEEKQCEVPVPLSPDGITVAVLKSPRSLLARGADAGDMVVYADSL